MPITATATFESGLLRPTEPLNLPDRSLVHLVIASPEERDAISISSRHLAARLKEWLPNSGTQVVSAPSSDPATLARLDLELDQLLDEIDRETANSQSSTRLSAEEIESLVSEATEALRGV